jgi:hypothetical protein
MNLYPIIQSTEVKKRRLAYEIRKNSKNGPFSGENLGIRAPRPEADLASSELISGFARLASGFQQLPATPAKGRSLPD